MRDIPGFKLQMAEDLANTSDEDQRMDSPIFACHQSNEGEEFVCAGWAAIHGPNSISLRLSMTFGSTPMDVADEAPCDWPDLHDSYEDMMDKLRDQFEHQGSCDE